MCIHGFYGWQRRWRWSAFWFFSPQKLKQELTKCRDKNVLEPEPRFESVTNISNSIHEHACHSRTYYKRLERNLHTLAHPFQVPGDRSLCDGNATLEFSCCTFRFRKRKMERKKKNYENKFTKWKTKARRWSTWIHFSCTSSVVVVDVAATVVHRMSFNWLSHLLVVSRMCVRACFWKDTIERERNR